MFEKKSTPSFLLFHSLVILVALSAHAEGVRASGALVKKEERRPVVSTEYGEISAVRISDGINGSYLLHFFTLEPDSLFLPAVLNADMIFYVHTGSGKLSWVEEDELKRIDLKRGDVYRLPRGAVFFIRCHSETQRLRFHAIFAHSNHDLREPATAPYSSVQGMVLGFDKKVLQATFKVSEEVIDQVLDGTKPPAIIHVDPAWEMESGFASGYLESRSYNIFELNKKKKRATLFNLFEEDKDLENCNGWITTVTNKNCNIGLFMVNLAAGSMMGPHWNSMDTEIKVVLEGQGMVRAVCSSISEEKLCRNTRFAVEEGDVFVVPRFHATAQMAFNNGTFSFMGFSTIKERNQAQFLAGQASVLRILDRDVLAMSFNVTNTTVEELLAPPDDDSVILGCTSCAEEELRILEREMEEEGGEREEEREMEEEAGQQGGEEEREQGGSGAAEKTESGREEEERGGGSGGDGGKGEQRGTEVQHQNHNDHNKWERRSAKNIRRLSI